MLSTALLDNIIAVDTQKQQVTVQAGARVDQVSTTSLVRHLLVVFKISGQISHHCPLQMVLQVSLVRLNQK